MNKKVRMTIEFEIDNEMVETQNITTGEVVDGIRLFESDEVDGFEITTILDDFDCTLDFFLTSGSIVGIEVIN